MNDVAPAAQDSGCLPPFGDAHAHDRHLPLEQLALPPGRSHLLRYGGRRGLVQ